MANNNSIWLEVESVRTDNNDGLSVKIKGDRNEPRWWPVSGAAAAVGFDTINSALENSHIVLAEIQATNKPELSVATIRIQRKDNAR